MVNRWFIQVFPRFFYIPSGPRVSTVNSIRIINIYIYIYILPSLKLTAKAPENRSFPIPKGKAAYLPTIHFSGAFAVSFREGIGGILPRMALSLYKRMIPAYVFFLCVCVCDCVCDRWWLEFIVYKLNILCNCFCSTPSHLHWTIDEGGVKQKCYGVQTIYPIQRNHPRTVTENWQVGFWFPDSFGFDQ